MDSLVIDRDAMHWRDLLDSVLYKRGVLGRRLSRLRPSM